MFKKEALKKLSLNSAKKQYINFLAIKAGKTKILSNKKTFFWRILEYMKEVSKKLISIRLFYFKLYHLFKLRLIQKLMRLNKRKKEIKKYRHSLIYKYLFRKLGVIRQQRMKILDIQKQFLNRKLIYLLHNWRSITILNIQIHENNINIIQNEIFILQAEKHKRKFLNILKNTYELRKHFSNLKKNFITSRLKSLLNKLIKTSVQNLLNKGKLSLALNKLNEKLVKKICIGLFGYHKSILKLKENSMVYLIYWKKMILTKVFNSWKIFLKFNKQKKAEYLKTLNERNVILSNNSKLT